MRKKLLFKQYQTIAKTLNQEICTLADSDLSLEKHTWYIGIIQKKNVDENGKINYIIKDPAEITPNLVDFEILIQMEKACTDAAVHMMCCQKQCQKNYNQLINRLYRYFNNNYSKRIRKREKSWAQWERTRDLKESEKQHV